MGNRRLRVMIATNLQAYVEAPSRGDKSKIIDMIVSQIRETSYNGGFVKKMPNGHWVEIGPTMSREKVGHAFRDCMKPLKNKVPEHDKQELVLQAQNFIFTSLQLCRPSYSSSTTTCSSYSTSSLLSDNMGQTLQSNQDVIFQSLMERSEGNNTMEF